MFSPTSERVIDTDTTSAPTATAMAAATPARPATGAAYGPPRGGAGGRAHRPPPAARTARPGSRDVLRWRRTPRTAPRTSHRGIGRPAVPRPETVALVRTARAPDWRGPRTPAAGWRCPCGRLYRASASPATTGVMRSCGHRAGAARSGSARRSAPRAPPPPRATVGGVGPAVTDRHRHEQHQAQQHHLKLRHARDPDHHAEHEEQTIVADPLPSNQ
jgi:hypothetical protein